MIVDKANDQVKELQEAGRPFLKQLAFRNEV